MTAIYLLKDPTTYEIRYVGKSVNPTARYSKHLFESKKKGKKNYLYCWIRSLIIKDLKPLMEIIEYCDNWQEREKFWINYYSNEKLTNLSEGGVGSTGYKHTEEWKRAASERMKNNKIMTGRKLSEETKKKMSINNAAAKNAYPIYQYDENMNFIKKWSSVKEAANYYNVSINTIRNNINNYSKKTKCGIWRKHLCN